MQRIDPSNFFSKKFDLLFCVFFWQGLCYVMLRYVMLHYFMLRYVTLCYVTLSYVMCCVVLRCVALRCVALRCVALRCVALRCVAVLCCAVLCYVVSCNVMSCNVMLCLHPQNVKLNCHCTMFSRASKEIELIRINCLSRYGSCALMYIRSISFNSV